MEEIGIAVMDTDHSELSRTVTRMAEASPKLNIRAHLSSSDQLETAFLQHRDVHGILYIPKGFENDVMNGRSARVVFYTNSSNIVFGNILKKEAYTLINTVMAGALIKRMQLAGKPYRESLNRTFPIRTEVKSLYNPSYNYLYYLVPGLMTVLLQMILFFSGAKAFNSEWNYDRFASLIAVSRGRVMAILAGKWLVYLLFGYVLSLFIFGVIFAFFQIPFSGSYFHLFFLLTIFITANVLLGFAVSAFVDDEVMAMDVSFFYNSPAFVFSGFTFPVFAMPVFSRIYAQIIPYTHFLDGFFKIYQMNVPLEYVAPEISTLLWFVLAGFLASATGIWLKVNKAANPGFQES